MGFQLRDADSRCASTTHAGLLAQQQLLASMVSDPLLHPSKPRRTCAVRHLTFLLQILLPEGRQSHAFQHVAHHGWPHGAVRSAHRAREHRLDNAHGLKSRGADLYSAGPAHDMATCRVHTRVYSNTQADGARQVLCVEAAGRWRSCRRSRTDCCTRARARPRSRVGFALATTLVFALGHKLRRTAPPGL